MFYLFMKNYVKKKPDIYIYTTQYIYMYIYIRVLALVVF
jgi:hypothetical protein